MGGGKKKNNQPQIVCEVCRDKINELGGNFMQCPYCRRSTHYNCAVQSKLISSNLFYYCPDHEKNAGQFLNRNPEKRRGDMRTVENAESRKGSVNTGREANEKTVIEPSNLLQSFITIQDSRLNSTTINDPDINLKKSENGNSVRTIMRRTANHPGMIILPEPCNQTCDSCKQIVVDMFFGCRICKKYFHGDCVDESERVNAIEEYWACTNCLRQWEEYCRQFHPSDTQSNSSSHATTNVDDGVPRTNKETENPDNKCKNKEEPSEKNKSELDLNYILSYITEQQRKLSEEVMKRVSEQLDCIQSSTARNPQAQSTPQNSVNPPKVNTNLIPEKTTNPQSGRIEINESEAVRSNERIINLTQRELDAVVEASIRRSAGMNHRQSNQNEHLNDHNNVESASNLRETTELNRMLVQMQLRETRKNTYRDLPKVTQANYEWKTFYSSFLSTKELFEPQENVRRIQDAIQCNEIKALGGFNLLNLNTYERTLEEIDKRVAKPEKLLIKDKQKLVDHAKISNGDKKAMIKFIDEIRKYSTLVDKIGSPADKSDHALISRLSRIIPDRMIQGWSKHYRKTKNETGEVILSDMAEWLDEQIENIEAESLFEETDPYGEIKGVKSWKFKDKTASKKSKDSLMFTHQEKNSYHNDSEKSVRKNDSPAQFCWYHKRPGHSSLNCYSLLAKTGQEVTRIAKGKGICLICGKKGHKVCPQREKFSCMIPGCTFKHAIIFCFKRKCQKYVDLRENKNQQQNEEKQQEDTPNNILTAQERAQASMHTQEGSVGLNVVHTNEVGESSLANHMYNALHSNNRLFGGSQNHTIVEKSTENEMSVLNHNLNKNANLSIVCVTLNNDEKSMKCALLLDSGSTISLIDERCANLLNLKGPNKITEIAWSGGRSREDKTSRIVKAKVLGFHKNAKIHEIYFRTIKDLDMPTQKFDAEEAKKKFPHLKDLPLTSYSQIVGIIGTDQHWFFRQEKWITAKGRNSLRDAPVAISTPLGYCVIGSSDPLPKTYEKFKERNEVHSTFHLNDEEEEELERMQSRAMGAEYLMPYVNDRKIADEEEAIHTLKSKVRRIPNENCFEAPLLWNCKEISLPTTLSYEMSVKRLKLLIAHGKRLNRLPEIRKEIKNLLEKKYARQLNKEEILNPPKNAFYIPIFITAQKGKRIRLVWDAAAKAGSNSLNDFLNTGPNLYTDLLSLIMQAREGKYLVKADIAEMFHQVKIIPEDRPALRFIFMNEETNTIEHFEMNVLIFGANCSPTISQYVKNQIAQEIEKNHPKVAKIIKENTYVDDVVFSFDDLKEGKMLIYEVRKVLKTGGFNLVKLQGNNPEILDIVRENLSIKEKEDPKILSTVQEEKLLGYNMNYKNDTIALSLTMDQIPIKSLDKDIIPTKKEILKTLMSLFDPIGLFSFFTSKLKLLYHWCCKEKLEWNGKITDRQIPYWKKILKWMEEIIKLKIPRPYCLRIEEAKTRQLLIFGDAGKEMLCAVAYIRLLNNERKQIGYRLVASKTYTVPLKQKRSIPELELDIAEKATQLKKLIEKAHSVKFDETYFATDSGCVYHWIKNGAHKPTLYVKNRLSKIHLNSKKEQWMWIPTNFQPADYGTKFDSIPRLTNDNEWFEPEIFSLPEGNWFQLKPPIKEIEDQLYAHCSIRKLEKQNKDKSNHLAEKYSSYAKMKRSLSVNSLCKKYLDRLLIKALRKINEGKDDEEATARIKDLENITNKSYEERRKDLEMEMIRDAQQECFKEELKALKKAGTLPKKSKYYKVSPFIDSENVMRITTRLPQSKQFDYDKTNPIMLPKNHRLTDLIIMHYHIMNKHQLHKNVIIELKQRFFIPAIAFTVRKSIKRLCFKCRRENAKPDRPMMGDLPGYRLASYESAFKYVIIDVCGPFSIRVNRRTQKRWLLVISCLTTRAVNIEVLHTSDSQSFLMALQNHINLRGAPTRIICDNGLNFVGGSNNLKECEKRWNAQLMEKGVIAKEIEFEFSPAKASSMNGSIERMVGLTKNILKKMNDSLNKKLIFPSEEVFKCISLEIVGLLNNRPLTMIPFEGTDNTFITPNHFLMQRQNFQIAPSAGKFEQSFIKRWDEVKRYIKDLWDHFNSAYIQELIHREKWFDRKSKLEVGDIVVTADPTVANLWRLGIIIKVEEGSKDQTRKVVVRLGKRNAIDAKALKSKKDILNAYKRERYSEVTRPASEVAHINLND